MDLHEDDGKDAILTVVEKKTKMVYFIPCTKLVTKKDTAQLFWSWMGSLHGIPSAIVSDRDVHFTGSFWHELWRILGIGLQMGIAYHPQSSGQVKHYNQVLSQLLQCAIHQVGDGAHWTDLLPTIQFTANTSPSRSTGYTQFFLNFGRHPMTPIQLLDQYQIRSKTEVVSTYVQHLRDQFVKA